VRPEACTSDELKVAFILEPYSEAWKTGPNPVLPLGTIGATVMGYAENMTVINLKTDDNKSLQIRWPGVISEFDVGSRVFVDQTRDWTIVRRSKSPLYAAAMHRYLGDIPDLSLEDLPLGGPSLRFAMQCNIQDQGGCVFDAVELQSGEGADLVRIATGTTAIIGNWQVHNRTLTRTDACAHGTPALASLITAEGRP
jgi:hypothetical protein